MRDKIYNTKKHIDINDTRLFSALGGIFSVIFFCVSCNLMAGCGKQDEVLVIPMEQSDLQKDACSVEDMMLGSTTGSMPYTTQGGEGRDELSDTFTPEASNIICVYVCGAVVNPGVVELPWDSRVADALEACGGFTEDARRDVINLAEKVTDQDMVRIPSLDEDIFSAETGQREKDGKININTADVSQLITLSGIGESRARDIITYREANGDFASTEDIKKVPGIKESIYSKICDKITVK